MRVYRHKDDIKVMGTKELFKATLELLNNFNAAKNIHMMQSLGDTCLNEHQFVTLLGRMRLYQCLPQGYQKAIPRMLLTDTQVNSVAKPTLMTITLAVLAVTYPCGSSTTCLLAATRAAT